MESAGWTVGTYVVGTEEITLSIPDDELGQRRLDAALRELGASDDDDMNLRLVAVILGLASGRGTEWAFTKIPSGVVSRMLSDLGVEIQRLGKAARA